MKTLSLITVGRDDKFADDFIYRLHKSITSNIKFLEKNNINFEYIVVDWFPINDQFLHKNEDMKKVLSDSRIKNIVVTNQIAEREGLNSLVFYEYFAKNVGIREAKNDYVFIVNSDIIIPQVMWDRIIPVLNTHNTSNFFRPWERVNVEFIGKNEVNVCDTLVLKEPGLPDECICGGYSGDFLLVDRATLIERGKGYNEEDLDHRQKNKWQTGMDAEILWNMYNNGVTLQFLNAPYYHIKHGNAAPQVSTGVKQVDGFYKINAHYNNKSNWGFIDYKHTKSDNITYVE
jgi:hypothetical protein